MQGAFFALLRLAIDNGQPLEKKLMADEWQAIYKMSEQQGLLAILFQAVSGAWVWDLYLKRSGQCTDVSQSPTSYSRRYRYLG